MVQRGWRAVLGLLVGVALVVVAAASSQAQGAPAPKPPKPVVSKVAPKTGPTAGGTKVTIKGKHLATATKVLFGTAKGLQLSVKSDRKLTVVTPAHAAGSVDVRVKTKGGKSKAAAAARFTFVAPAPPPPPAPPAPPPPPPVNLPTVTGVNPSSGPAAGGTVVTVTGTNLAGATSVTFGGTPGTGLDPVSDTELEVTSPPHGAGVVDVVVSTPSGTSATGAPAQFTYTGAAPLPSIEAVDPGSGPAAGGAVVTVFGSGFTEATEVSFASTPGTGITVVDDSELTVTSPPHAAGVVDVRVTTPAGTSADVPGDDFEYVDPDSRAYAAPLPGDADQDGQGAFLNGVDCPAVQQCFAVGGYTSGGQRLPLAEQRVGPDSWQPFSPPLPDDAAPGADTQLQDVDCASSTFCVAVGTYVDEASEYLPFIETWDGEAWEPSTATTLPTDADFSVFDDQLLADVECAAVGVCVAAGRYHESENGDAVPLLLELSGGAWTTQEIAGRPAIGEIAAVDCPSVSSCIAVGEHTSGSRRPLAVTGPGTWTASTALPLPGNVDANPGAGLVDVSCSAVGSCMAIGSYRAATPGIKVQGLVELLSGSTWTAAAASAPATPSTATNPQVVLNSVSCASTCAAVGDYSASALAGGQRRPLLVRLNGTTPVAVRGEVPDDPDGALNSSSTTVTCATGNRCLGVGYYDDGSGVWTPLLSSLEAAAWTEGTGPGATDVAGVLRPAASVLDGNVAVAVGLYNDEAGGQQALIMLDLAV